jgi:YesN/AraC family two-component response regulator
MFSNELICNILNYINTNLYEEITIDSIANYFYFNRTYVMKKFKKEIGVSIINYINIKKIYNSLKYIKDNKSILEIALLNGYNSQEYYSEIFKSIIGVPPLIYRKYLSFITDLDDKKINIIQNNIFEIESLLSKTQRYLNNRKPVNPIKKISL